MSLSSGWSRWKRAQSHQSQICRGRFPRHWPDAPTENPDPPIASATTTSDPGMADPHRRANIAAPSPTPRVCHPNIEQPQHMHRANRNATNWLELSILPANDPPARIVPSWISHSVALLFSHRVCPRRFGRQSVGCYIVGPMHQPAIDNVRARVFRLFDGLPFHIHLERSARTDKWASQ